MQFASDNWAGAHPSIMEAIAAEATRFDAAYGDSDADRRVRERFCELFGRDVAVFLVGTGTAANGLALAATAARPGGIVLCHRDSHINVDECGGVTHQADGLRLNGLSGALGKISAEQVRAEIAAFPTGHVHAGQLTGVSLTQATEAGTTYSLGETRDIAAAARARGLAVHMDGARLGNALVHLGASPASMTAEAGVDILSFGGTKNGCINAEAVIVFDPERARELPFLRMRAGHLFSKSRFIAAQFEAYLKDGLWIELAAHANAMADRLRSAISASKRARLAWPSEINEVFAVFSSTDADRMVAAGARMHQWTGGADGVGPRERAYRLVTSFMTAPEEIDRLADLIDGA